MALPGPVAKALWGEDEPAEVVETEEGTVVQEGQKPAERLSPTFSGVTPNMSPELQERLWGDHDRQSSTDPAPHIGAMDRASQENPDAVLEALRAEQETGIPYEVAKEDPEEAKRQAWLKSLGLDMMEEEAPGTAEWLSNDQNAAVTNDDWDTLKNLERLAKRQESYDMMSFEDAGKIFDSWLVTMGRIPAEFKYNMLNDPDNFIRRNALNTAEIAKAQGDEEKYNEMMAQIEAQDQELARLDEFLDDADYLQSKLQLKGLVKEGIQVGGQMALDMSWGLMISAATKGKINPTLPALTGRAYLQSAVEAQREGMDWTTAQTYGASQALVEYLTEKFPQRAIEKVVGDLGGDGIGQALKRWGYMEAGTEQLATAGNTIVDVLYGMDEEMANAQGFAERAEIQVRRQLVTAIGTLVGGGGISGTLYSMDRVLGRRQRAQKRAMKAAFDRSTSEQSQAGLDELFSLAQSSKTNERDADRLEDFLMNVAVDGKIFMEADAVDILDEIPEYIQVQLDGSRADVVIPLARFVRDFAGQPDKLAEVRRHIKSAAHLQTQAELEGNTDSNYIAQVLREAAEHEETRNAADQIYDQIVQELVATGRQGPNTARQSAQLIPAFITTQYENLKAAGITEYRDGRKITLESLFEDMGLRVVGPEVEVGMEADMVSQAVEAATMDPSVYHVTFKKNVERIQEQGLVPLQTSNWVRNQAEMEGIRYNEDGGLFAFEHPEDAYRWAHKMGFEFQEAVSIVKMNRDGEWELDPSEDISLQMGKGRSLRREGMVQPEDILGSVDFEEFGSMLQFDSQEEFFDFVATKLRGISETSRVLRQSDLDNITITETVVDEDGNPFTIKQNAATLFREQRQRLAMVEQLRGCIRG